MELENIINSWITKGIKIGLREEEIIIFIVKTTIHYTKNNKIDNEMNGDYKKLINYIDYMLMKYYIDVGKIKNE